MRQRHDGRRLQLGLAARNPSGDGHRGQGRQSGRGAQKTRPEIDCRFGERMIARAEATRDPREQGINAAEEQWGRDAEGAIRISRASRTWHCDSDRRNEADFLGPIRFEPTPRHKRLHGARRSGLFGFRIKGAVCS